MKDSRQSIFVFFLGYLLLFFLIGLMLWPFISSIIFAAILAGTFSPLNDFFNRYFKKQWSALLICLIIVLALFLPSILIVMKLSEEALVLYQNIKDYLSQAELEKLLFGIGFVGDTLKEIFKIANLEYNFETIKKLLLTLSTDASTIIFDIVNSWISNVVSFLFHFFVMLVVVYTILVEGTRLKRFFLALSPLPDEEEELVIDKFNQINYVTIVGNGIGGLIQGLLAGIGFFFAGIQSIALWTTLMVFLAFIPIVGISIVYVPACIYLVITGHMTAGIILFIYCTAVAQTVENWFKPRFVGNRVKISSTLVFLSIIGGLSVFGVAGIFYGPLIISIFLTFVDLYHKRYSGENSA